MSVEEFLASFDTGTRRVYAAGLEAFVTFYRTTGNGTSLEEFLDSVEADLRRPRREKTRVARTLLREFVKWQQDHNYAPKTIRTYVSAIQSFARFYDLIITTRYVPMPSSRPVSEKFPWSIEQVATFIEQIPHPEIQAIAVTIFQSGLSISDILNLTYRDIKYEYAHDMVPLCFDLSRIKTDVPFMTFIGQWGVTQLQHHLKRNRPKRDEPIYTVSHRTIDYHFQKLGKRWVGDYKGFNPCRPHSLRAAFKTILGDAGCPHDFIEFWMGHELPEQKRVYESRTRDGWRELYRTYNHALEPSVT